MSFFIGLSHKIINHIDSTLEKVSNTSIVHQKDVTQMLYDTANMDFYTTHKLCRFCLLTNDDKVASNSYIFRFRQLLHPPGGLGALTQPQGVQRGGGTPITTKKKFEKFCEKKKTFNNGVNSIYYRPWDSGLQVNFVLQAKSKNIYSVDLSLHVKTMP